MLEFFRDEMERERENRRKREESTRHDRTQMEASKRERERKRSRRKIFRDSVVDSRRSDVVKSWHRIYDVSRAKMQTVLSLSMFRDGPHGERPHGKMIIRAAGMLARLINAAVNHRLVYGLTGER